MEEILKDLKRGAERAREHGALGWYVFQFSGFQANENINVYIFTKI